MKGEKTSQATQSGKSPSSAPQSASAAASSPRLDEPTSPRKMRAGGKLLTRKPPAEAATPRQTSE